MGRAPCCSKVGLNRGAWTVAEDKLLVDYITKHGEGRWRSLPKEAGLKRCGKSCRLRWLNYLRPDIKRGNITPEEEDLIIRLHKLLGNRWSLIAGRLPGRTDNEIKNYWNTALQKKVQGDQKSSPSDKIIKKKPRRNKPKSTKPASSTTHHHEANSQTQISSKAVRTKAMRCTKVVMITQPQLLPCTQLKTVEKNDIDSRFSNNAGFEEQRCYWNASDECLSLSSGDDTATAPSGEENNLDNLSMGFDGVFASGDQLGGGSDSDFWNMLNDWIMDDACQS